MLTSMPTALVGMVPRPAIWILVGVSGGDFAVGDEGVVDGGAVGAGVEQAARLDGGDVGSGGDVGDDVEGVVGGGGGVEADGAVGSRATVVALAMLMPGV